MRCYNELNSKSTPRFALSAKTNEIQRRTDVSHALYVLWYEAYAKGICQAETMSNSEKIKFVSLAAIELCLSEGISQSVTVQNQSQYKIPLNNFF